MSSTSTSSARPATFSSTQLQALRPALTGEVLINSLDAGGTSPQLLRAVVFRGGLSKAGRAQGQVRSGERLPLQSQHRAFETAAEDVGAQVPGVALPSLTPVRGRARQHELFEEALRGLLSFAQRTKVVDDAPDILVRNAAIESGHHAWREAALDDVEYVAVARTVIRLIIGEVRWLLAALLLDDRNRHAGFDRALRPVSVAGGAVGVVGPLPGGDRFWRRCDGISHVGR